MKCGQNCGKLFSKDVYILALDKETSELIACLEGDGHGSLAYYSLWGRKESDTTERLN